MYTVKINEMSDSQFNSLFNAVIEEKTRREETKKQSLLNEFYAIYNKIVEEGFDVDYYGESFDIDGISIC